MSFYSHFSEFPGLEREYRDSLQLAALASRNIAVLGLRFIRIIWGFFWRFFSYFFPSVFPSLLLAFADDGAPIY